MHVHIWPSRTREVLAANAAMRVHASWVAAWECSGVVWKWSLTQIDSKVDPASARWASPFITAHCSAGGIPTRSKRQPCGMKSPSRMLATLPQSRSNRYENPGDDGERLTARLLR